MEYKFRAWIEAIKCMLYKVDVYANGNIGITYANLPEELFKLYYVDWDDSCIRECGTDIHVINILTGEEYIWFESGFVLMQHTGKSDNDNNEIFDGDIVEFDKNEWGGENNIHSVSWDEYDARWEWGGGTSGSDMHFRKVIGNKYQHPHLLPQNNKKGGA